jgi:4-alpha-glucanotransferase
MLARFRILSYRLFYFEKYRDGRFKQTYEYPRQALVASSTHDLPTLCGYWLGRDIEARKQAGLADDADAGRQFEERRGERQNMLNALHNEHLLPPSYPRDADQIPEVDGELHQAIVAFLARVPSMLLLLNQEDLTKETEQQNLPGSTSEYLNWQRKMRARLEDLDAAWAPYAQMLRQQLASNDRLV